MKTRTFPYGASLEPAIEKSLVSCRSSSRRLGKVKLAIMEVGLCFIVPCATLMIWGLFDEGVRTSLLSSSRNDSSTAFNRVIEMVPLDENSVLSVEFQGRIRYWDLARDNSSGEIQSRMSDVTCASFEPRNRLLALGSLSGKIELWDLEQPHEPIATTNDDDFEVEACKFTPDGRFLCSAGGAGEAVIWDVGALTRVHILRHSPTALPIREVDITPDGKYLLTGDKGGVIRIWDLTDHRLVHTLNVAGYATPTACEFSSAMIEAILPLPNPDEFAVVTRSAGISVWNLSTGDCTRRWAGGESAFHAACVSADGQRLIAGNAQGEIWTWETTTGRCLKSQAPHSTIVRSLACNRTGTIVISGDCRGEIHCR